MSTFVYAPGIKVYIDSYRLGQIVDVSADLTGANMQRRSDGVSQFQFGLINPLRKYDNVFTPNDRIVVMMKRLTWLRTFTGYLNQVPIFSSWPRDVDLSASCSLKRLQYFFWDPELAASQQLVRSSMTLPQDGSPPDGGTKQAVINLLEEVVDWSGAQAAKNKSLAGSKIHIGGIPKDWFGFAGKVLQEVAKNVQDETLLATNLIAAVGGDPSLGAPAGTPSATAPVGAGALPAGNYGRASLTAKQAANASLMMKTAFADGASVQQVTLAVGCCLQESKFINYSNYKLPESRKINPDPQEVGGKDIPGGSNSVGIFQQQAILWNNAWGTVAQCMDIPYATKRFLKELRKIKGHESLPFTVAIQKVQNSGVPNAYAQWEGAARTIVATYTASAAGASPGTTTSSTAGTQPTTTPGLPQTGRTTGAQILQVAQQLVSRNIPYVFGTKAPAADQAYNNPSPRSHDCSSFMRWVYFQSLGNLGSDPMPRNSAAQYEWASRNGRAISVEEAGKIPGAMLFRGREGHNIGHVEYSMGDGVRSIGTRQTGTPASIINYRPGYWKYAALPPNVDFGSGAVGTALPTVAGAPSTGNVSAALEERRTLAETIIGDNPADSLDSLFGSSPWIANQADTGFAESLVGIRAMANDSPILPYIKNLMNASMRQFSSAPNGDFIGWFPDYFGMWGTAARMVLQPIEVKDFTVTWSDEYLVTHQYVVRTEEGTAAIDLATGQGLAGTVASALTSFGIATIDIESMMGVLFGLAKTPAEAKKFKDFYYQRFGPRPDYTQIPGVSGYSGEFFMALYLFMQNWTQQYNANIDITYMPELFPGMIVAFEEYNFQAYVNTVEHTVAFGPGGGFKTRINIQAPARIRDTGGEDKMIGLPIAGKKGPSTPAKGKNTAPPKKGQPQKTPANPRLERL